MYPFEVWMLWICDLFFDFIKKKEKKKKENTMQNLSLVFPKNIPLVLSMYCYH